MSFVTPQEKKRRSYARDHRNAYGQNNKASRKLIPTRKKKSERAYRKNTAQQIPALRSPAELLQDDDIEHRIATVQKKRWRKVRDIPLGDFVQRQADSRVARDGRKKRSVKSA
jgi:hypothetical protein